VSVFQLLLLLFLPNVFSLPCLFLLFLAIEMPAQRSRGGARGGGMAREWRHDGSAQGGAEEMENRVQVMRDRGHAE
jgi:hypothetical protein